MAHDNRDSIDFGKANVGRLFAALFVPTLAGMLCNIAFLLTDGIFVGHRIGPEGLASINLIAPVMMFINGVGAMMGIGASVVAAIHLSHSNVKAARINITQAFIASATMGLMVGAVLYAMPEMAMRLLGVDASLHDATREYLLWFIPTCLLLLVQTLGMYVIRLDGAPRYAMLSNMVPSAVNIFFDWLFIYPLGMGLKGAALATDIGGAVGVAMVMGYMLLRPRTLRFYRLKPTATSLRLTLRNVGYMVKVGLSGFVGELAVSVMMLAGNLGFGRLVGVDGVSAWSIVCYLFPVVYMIYLAVSQSAQPIISFNHGAGQLARAKRALNLSVGAAVGFGLVLCAVFVFASKAVVGIFIDSHTEAYTLATEGLPLFAVGLLLCGFNICYIGYLQSVERATAATLLMLLRGVVLPVLAFWLLPKTIGTLAGLWLAVPASEGVCFFSIILKKIVNLRF